jgi:hypothetical protein
MSPEWGSVELKSIAQGRLRFSPEQIRRIGQAIVTRATSDRALTAMLSMDLVGLGRGEVQN